MWIVTYKPAGPRKCFVGWWWEGFPTPDQTHRTVSKSFGSSLSRLENVMRPFIVVGGQTMFVRRRSILEGLIDVRNYPDGKGASHKNQAQ